MRALLGAHRLVTLTGPGGVGKTRLALHAAAAALDAFADGAWVAALEALAEPALVPQTVAAALGVPEAPGRAPLTALADHLRDRTLLLVLDNCEHLLEAAAALADALLRACPGLRVLATSRALLGVPGEAAFRVPSLSLPAPPDPPAPAGGLAGRLGRSEAVALFVERARLVRPGFALTAQNAAAVAQVCRRLDGVPLALELAAARVGVLSAAQLAARLDDRFRLLTAGPRTALPRQQTLRAAVDWSHALLSGPERALLRRLAVFAGGWTLEAGEAVAAGDGLEPRAVLDLLARLVDQSLVLADVQRGAARYRLLETLRQYAQEQLEEAGEAARTRDRHLAYFLRLAEEAEPQLRGPAARAAVERLEEEHDNLRLALEWALRAGGAGAAALRLSGALAWFWWGRNYHSEGRRWLARTLAAGPGRTAAHAKALHGAGWLAHHQRDLGEARARLGESLAIARERGDRWAVAWALHALGRVAYFEGDPAAAAALGGESLAVGEAVGDGWLVAWALHLLGIAAHLEADYPTARAYYERSLALRRGLGYQEGVGLLLNLLGIVAWREGDFARAHALQREALATLQGLLGSWAVGVVLANFAALAAVQGQPARAVRLASAAAALREAWQTPLIPLTEAVLAEALERAGRALDAAAYAAAWAEGRGMPLEQAIADALEAATDG